MLKTMHRQSHLSERVDGLADAVTQHLKLADINSCGFHN
jgi:hypothetical protein